MREPQLVTKEKIAIRADKFENGICAIKFPLGNEFNVSKQESTASLCLISSKSIYYETSDGMNILIVKEGGRVPYFTQIETWGDDAFKDLIFTGILDLRGSGLYGTDFNPNKINDGRGNFGHDFIMYITPQYYIYFNKQNAKEEIQNRLNKIRNGNKSNSTPFHMSLENILNSNKTNEEKSLQEDFKEVKEQYKQFTLDGYKTKSKENQLLASLADTIKSDFSSDVKIIMVRDILKRYDKN